MRHLLPWFVTRQVFTGAGKIGSENGAAAVDFQISQRADFFEEEVGLETTLKRPIVNTRDEPHADPQLYRRLHVIVGDANLCEVATFLKVGTTAIVLAMVEDDFIDTTTGYGARKDFSVVGPCPRCARSRTIRRAGPRSSSSTAARSPRSSCSGSSSGSPSKYADETGLELCGGERSAPRCSTVGGRPQLAGARSRRARRPARLGDEARSS